MRKCLLKSLRQSVQYPVEKVKKKKKVIAKCYALTRKRNKFDLHRNIIKNEKDTFMISETKTYSSFSIFQFTMTASSVRFRLDRKSHGVEYLCLSETMSLVKYQN